jgi:hypothetical protein
MKGWKQKHPQNFDFRLLTILPAFGFFITDAGTEQQTVKIEIYTAKPHRMESERPNLIIKDNNWQNYFIQQWNNYWNLGIS